MSELDLSDPQAWCGLSFAEQRRELAAAVSRQLGPPDFVTDLQVESGTLGREFDLTVAVHTDVGVLRAPLWSHARATIFCDPSVHPSNRAQLAPSLAVDECVARLEPRLSVPFALESRGLTLTMSVEEGVERTWTAERSRFRNRTAVTREDVVRNAADDVDVRDLLTHFYSGPSLRVQGEDGQAFLVREASETEGPVVSLCEACGRWSRGSADQCPECGAATEVVIAARPPRR